VESVKASATWAPDVNRYTLWAEPPADRFVPEPFDDDPTASLLLEINGDGQETGRIAGVEIALLDFERWESVPDLPTLWQLPGREPLPLKRLLQQVQRELRQQARATPPRSRSS
jgi:hypothetical protein